MSVQGININASSIIMQNQSSLLTQMLNGASLSSLNISGTARSQAASYIRQYDTFNSSDVLSGGDSTGNSLSTGGTAYAQAKLLSHFDTFSRNSTEDESE